MSHPPDRELSPQFLEIEPPVWAARGLASILLGLAAAVAAAAVLVRVPEAVTATFVLVPLGGTDPLAATAPSTGSVVEPAAPDRGAPVQEGDVIEEVVGSGERLQAELTVPQGGMALLLPGQRVKLLYDAFPYQRYGAHSARIRWISPAPVGDGFHAFADLESDSFVVRGERRPVVAGMGGRARVVVGRRTLVSYAFEPLRQLRESLGDR